MENSIYKNLLIHSILIFVLCFILNTIIHEGAHALMAKAFGLNPVLHHNYVSTSDEQSSELAKILIPAAGPLMSLIQGVIFFILLRGRIRKSLITLFYLWMSVFGFINIGGYLMLTPLVEYGDTGKVFTLLNSPQWLKWTVAVVALSALVKIILNFRRDFENQVPAILPEGVRSGKLANLMILFPVLFGCVFNTLLSLPVPTFISVLYPATSSYITFMIYGRLRRKKELIGSAVYPESISILLIIIIIIAIIVSRLLVNGITL